MKLLYTQDNRYKVFNAKNIVENAGIEVILRNEFAIGAMGELSPFEAWLELWVVNDADYDKALTLIDARFAENRTGEWQCSRCQEINDPAFELCWNCQFERPLGGRVNTL